MNAIWKFPLSPLRANVIQAPGVFRPIAAQMQDDQLTLWAIVQPGLPLYPRHIHVVGTGHHFDAQDLLHIDTVQDGGMVWHVFTDA